MSDYDHRAQSRFTEDECEAAVGSRATLVLTGEIIDSGSSTAGPYVRFEADERFGFRELRFVLDLDALVVEERP